jgi:subtilase family serine protease
METESELRIDTIEITDSTETVTCFERTCVPLKHEHVQDVCLRARCSLTKNAMAERYRMENPKRLHRANASVIRELPPKLAHRAQARDEERPKEQDSEEAVPESNVTPEMIYYSPDQIRKCYGVDVLDPRARGQGVKVAVIVAYHYPGLQHDLDVYSEAFSIPKTKLQVTSLTRTQNRSWAIEACLDVQMVHMIAPQAEIHVVEAASATYNDLFLAIETAKNQGCSIVSMSWGASESKTSANYESHFTGRVCYVASSGDAAMTLNYPATSPNVLSVGGTSTYLNEDGSRHHESCWAQAGTGCSQVFYLPNYQTGLGLCRRQTPDVSAIADPMTGVIIHYNGLYYSTGGTSTSCPIVAGMIACANSLRINMGRQPLTTVASSTTCVQMFMYKTLYVSPRLYPANFYDVITGTDGSYSAHTGYDECTGLGTVRANALVSSLASI